MENKQKEQNNMIDLGVFVTLSGNIVIYKTEQG